MKQYIFRIKVVKMEFYQKYLRIKMQLTNNIETTDQSYLNDSYCT